MSPEYTFIFCERPNKVENQTFDFEIEWPVELQVGHAIELSVTNAIAAKIAGDKDLIKNLPSEDDARKQIEGLIAKEEEIQHPAWLLENDLWRVDHIYHRSNGNGIYQCTWVLISPYPNHPCRK